MLNPLFVLLLTVFFNIKIETHRQDYFNHKKEFQQQEKFSEIKSPEIKFTETENILSTNIQDLIPKKTILKQVANIKNRSKYLLKINDQEKENYLLSFVDEDAVLANLILQNEKEKQKRKLACISIVIGAGAGAAGAGAGIGAGAAGVGAGIGGVIGGIISGPAIPIIIGGSILGWGIKEIIISIKGKKDKQQKKNNSGGGGNGDGGNGDDDDEETKRKKKEQFEKDHPNGEYENNPKHHQNSSGDTSKCPKNGQKALDRAIKTKNGKWQVSIEDGKFVIFEQHSPGKWHGYAIENPANMHQDIKNLLFKEGWIPAPNKFKIIKRF
jgi:hypothetical protein